MKNSNDSVKYSHLIVVITAFALGIILTLSASNVLDKEILKFSTLGLVGFVFSIILGGASIVLAINAIHLGRSSETAIINRNDEGIRMQNEVFHRTIEALSRIESSTGVTEKRIEDIIAGRAGHFAEKISSENIRGRDAIQRELIKSFSERLSPEELQERKKEEDERKRAQKRYEDYHDKLLISLSNDPNIRLEQLAGHGDYSGTGTRLFDDIFFINSKKVGISIFSDEPALEYVFVPDFKEFINKISHEISKKTIDYFFYLSNKKSRISEKFQKELKEATALLREELQDKMFIQIGDDTKLIEYIIKTVK